MADSVLDTFYQKTLRLRIPGSFEKSNLIIIFDMLADFKRNTWCMWWETPQSGVFLNELFGNLYDQMQETWYDCFGSKKCCCYFAVFVLIYFLLTNDRVTYFRGETIVASFLHLIVFICKMFINRTWNIKFLIYIYIKKMMFGLFYLLKLLRVVNGDQ